MKLNRFIKFIFEKIKVFKNFRVFLFPKFELSLKKIFSTDFSKDENLTKAILET